MGTVLDTRHNGGFATYLWTNGVNGKRYVGKSKNPHARCLDHLNVAERGLGSALHRAIRVHGKDAFAVEIIEWCATEDNAFASEIFWIEWYEAFGPRGYNMTAGGEGAAHSQSLETRAKMSASRRGKLLSDAHREAISRGRIGLRATPEARAILSAAHIGKPWSAVRRARYTEARYARQSAVMLVDEQ